MRVIRVNDGTAGSYGYVRIDCDFALADDMNALLDPDAVSQCQRRVPAQVRPMDYLDSGEVANMAMLTDEDALSA